MLKVNHSFFCFTLFFLIKFSQAHAPNSTKSEWNILKGVTRKQALPFVVNVDGKYRGFAIDLMRFISKQNGFKFELYHQTEQGKGNEDKKMKEPINLFDELKKKRADFALADLTVSDERKNFLDFSEPFMQFTFAALIHKNHSDKLGLKSIEDLAKSQLPIIVIHNGTTSQTIQKNEKNSHTIESLKRKLMNNWNKRKKFNQIGSSGQALRLIKSEKIAWLGERPTLQFFASNDCQLKLLVDDENLINGAYALALPKNSSYLESFNGAVKKFKSSNLYQKSFERFWQKAQCNE